jgi:hypothetical protein
MDYEYAVVQSSGRVAKRLDGASVQDPSLNLPQRGEIENRRRINQPHSQALPE